MSERVALTVALCGFLIGAVATLHSPLFWAFVAAEWICAIAIWSAS